MIDITTLGIIPIGSITVICFLMGAALKAYGEMDKWIPVFCGTLGGLLGLLWYIFEWTGLNAQEPVTAVSIGIVSGLAATGVHQIGKQLSGKE